MHFYPHHIGDYQRDTAHLSVTEHGVYRLLMDHYYATEKPLPQDLAALCRIIRATTKAERDAVATIVVTFFKDDAAGLRHKRIENELSTYAIVKERNQTNGKKGGRPHKPKPIPPPPPQEPSGLSLGLPDGTKDEPSQEPRTKSEKPPPNPQGGNGSAPEAFEKFWLAYPKKTGRKKALEAWRKARDKPPIEAILATITAQKAGHEWQKDGGQFIPNPATWINQGRWDDQPFLSPNGSTTKPNDKRQHLHSSGATGLANAPGRYDTHRPSFRESAANTDTAHQISGVQPAAGTHPG